MSEYRGEWKELVIVRLASEGVPVNVIARAFSKSRPGVRAVLAAAKIHLPADEWPDDSQFTPTVKPLLVDVSTITLWRIENAFRMSPAQARLMGGLLHNEYVGLTVGKLLCSNDGTSRKILHVHIYHLRRILDRAGFPDAIKTNWGRAYSIVPVTRSAILDYVVERTRHLDVALSAVA